MPDMTSENHLPFSVYGLLSPITCLLSHVSCLLSPVSCLPFPVPSLVTCLSIPVSPILSPVYCLLSHIYHLSFLVSCLTSPVTSLFSCLLFHDSCLMSPDFCLRYLSSRRHLLSLSLISFLTSHVSHITSPVSCNPYLKSPVSVLMLLNFADGNILYHTWNFADWNNRLSRFFSLSICKLFRVPLRSNKGENQIFMILVLKKQWELLPL